MPVFWGGYRPRPCEQDAATFWFLSDRLRFGMYITSAMARRYTEALFDDEEPEPLNFGGDNDEATTQQLVEILMDLVMKAETHEVRLRAVETLRVAAARLPHANPREYARRCVWAYEMVVDGSWCSDLEMLETKDAARPLTAPAAS